MKQTRGPQGCFTACPPPAPAEPPAAHHCALSQPLPGPTSPPAWSGLLGEALEKAPGVGTWLGPGHGQQLLDSP